MIKFNAQIKASATKIDILESHLRTLRSRKEEYETLVQNVGKRLEELDAVKRDESVRIAEAEKKAIEYNDLKVQRTKEIQHANEVAKRAGSALIEIETQNNMAESLASDDKALKLIEEMATAGAVPGVYGRLSSLVKAKDGYAKAMEAAAAGWMKALVVKNIETALSCIEVLKKTKVGRVKIIPLQDLAPPKKPRSPKDLQEIIGPLTDQNGALLPCPPPSVLRTQAQP